MLRKGRKDALDTYNLENEDLRELRDLFVSDCHQSLPTCARLYESYNDSDRLRI